MQDMKALFEGKNGEKLRALAETPEAKALGALIDPAEMEKAARGGDAAALQEMLQRILSTPQGKKLAQDVSGAIKKK